MHDSAAAAADWFNNNNNNNNNRLFNYNLTDAECLHVFFLYTHTHTHTYYHQYQSNNQEIKSMRRSSKYMLYN